VALIDGEHYLPVIKDALRVLENEYNYRILAAVFIGGTEKILLDRDFSTLGIPVITEPEVLEGIRRAIAEYSPNLIIDLSDEPIVGYKERMLIASHVLKSGVSYAGADFRFTAPIFHSVAKKPSISIVGTGKRVGKTAVSAYFARELKKAGFAPVTIAMGRGGPERPAVIDGTKALTPEYLLQISKAGMHAASDAYEDALMSRITTVACRRCGGGLAGEPFVSNVISGVEIANQLKERFMLIEGSGASLPPVRTDACILTVGANQPIEYTDGYFGTYRVLLSDLVVITMCERPLSDARKVAAIRRSIEKTKPETKIVETIFRPVPLGSIEERKVFFATTGPELMNGIIKKYLEDNFGCEVATISNSLANRKNLLADLQANKGRFDLLLTELKAASVDVATKVGLDFGVDVVYCDNVPVTVSEGAGLAELMLDLAKNAKEQFALCFADDVAKGS
jgi:cyclic 2,3-diphosphoglycerate synthetase